MQVMERDEERQWNELRDAAYKEADEARDSARHRLEVIACRIVQNSFCCANACKSCLFNLTACNSESFTCLMPASLLPQDLLISKALSAP